MAEAELFAKEFSEIPAALQRSAGLREHIQRLIVDGPVLAKVTEEADRLARFRSILRDLVGGNIELETAVQRAERELPREQSVHRDNNRVFPRGWAERHVRTHYARFYNQAMLEFLMSHGITRCYVPHSSTERPDAVCSAELAGKTHDVALLYRRLVDTFGKGRRVSGPTIPNHPHCTHVVTPP